LKVIAAERADRVQRLLAAAVWLTAWTGPGDHPALVSAVPVLIIVIKVP